MLHTPEIPNHGQLAAKYSSISRACLALGDFITNTSLSAIDALLLSAGYYFAADDPSDAHKGAILLGVALKLAVGVRASMPGVNILLTPLSFWTDWTSVRALPVRISSN
jgi:hypothetical protein